MANLKRWIEKLEAQIDQQKMHRVTWAEVDKAAQHQQARVRLKVCRRLGIEAMDPHVMRVEAQLIHDSPELGAQDEETRHRWRQQQDIPPDSGDVRERIAQRLEATARRLGAEGSR